jgi:hypothetical protein
LLQGKIFVSGSTGFDWFEARDYLGGKLDVFTLHSLHS